MLVGNKLGFRSKKAKLLFCGRAEGMRFGLLITLFVAAFTNRYYAHSSKYSLFVVQHQTALCGTLDSKCYSTMCKPTLSQLVEMYQHDVHVASPAHDLLSLLGRNTSSQENTAGTIKHDDQPALFLATSCSFALECFFSWPRAVSGRNILACAV